MYYRANDLAEALELAEGLRQSGGADWFRGQTRNWPLLSTLTRRGPAGLQAARDQIGRFVEWVERAGLDDIRADRDAIFAVAQHYGLPTAYVDFTTEPRVAAFFAAHGAPPSSFHDEKELACIICFDTTELMGMMNAIAAVQPDDPRPELVEVRVDGLWRLEAQRGMFLYYPFDEGFERHRFNFDRIVFPAATAAAMLRELVPVDDIYPTQKSELEIALDRYFMIERLREGSALKETWSGLVINMGDRGFTDGIESECFTEAGIPPHESWSQDRLTGWDAPNEESWTPISKADSVTVTFPPVDDPTDEIELLAAQILEPVAALREWPVTWRVMPDRPSSCDVAASLGLVWDGLRRWPYRDTDLAHALATTAVVARLVSEHPTAPHDANAADAIVESCLGPSIEVEIGHPDGSYTRGYANRELLHEAVRPDFAEYLTDEWRARITSVGPILQIAVDPRRVFVFDEVNQIFARQIVPTQVVLRAEGSGKARFYNLAHVTRFGLP